MLNLKYLCTALILDRLPSFQEQLNHFWVVKNQINPSNFQLAVLLICQIPLMQCLELFSNPFNNLLSATLHILVIFIKVQCFKNLHLLLVKWNKHCIILRLYIISIINSTQTFGKINWNHNETNYKKSTENLNHNDSFGIKHLFGDFRFCLFTFVLEKHTGFWLEASGAGGYKVDVLNVVFNITTLLMLTITLKVIRKPCRIYKARACIRSIRAF